MLWNAICRNHFGSRLRSHVERASDLWETEISHYSIAVIAQCKKPNIELIPQIRRGSVRNRLDSEIRAAAAAYEPMCLQLRPE
jgi:hypothetical protein